MSPPEEDENLPQDKHRAWAEMIRTAAAIATLLISIGLLAEKLGLW